MKYKTIDICAGIGGIRKGFELTGGFTNVLSAEIDKYAAKTYKHLYGEDPLNDLTSEDFKQKVEETDYDILLAGFPCQTFSRVGKKQGFRDATRGTIFFDIADIVSRTNPKAIFLENVENIVSHDHRNTITKIIEILENELGYKVIGVKKDDKGDLVFDHSSFVRNTKNFGLPQNRPRAYFIAFNKKYYGKAINMLENTLPLNNDKVIFSDVRDILESDVDPKYYMASGYLNTLKKHKKKQLKKGNGFGYCVVNLKNRSPMYANTILATGGSGKERNLIYQKKDGVDNLKVPGKRTKINNEGIRMMTPKEWGRLQGFVDYAFVDKKGADHFSFPEGTTDGQKYKQLGNSVSIPVIETMAEFMLNCFKILEKQKREVITTLTDNRDSIEIKDIEDILHINYQEAYNIANRMVKENKLSRQKKGKKVFYSKTK